MPIDFSKIKALEITGVETADFTFTELSSEPKLTVRPAAEANAPFWNAVVKDSNRALKGVQTKNVTPALMREVRKADILRYSLFIVVGWENVQDASGATVPFSQENVLEFLTALPDRYFDQLRQFAGNADNFVQPAPAVEEAPLKN